MTLLPFFGSEFSDIQGSEFSRAEFPWHPSLCSLIMLSMQWKISTWMPVPWGSCSSSKGWRYGPNTFHMPVWLRHQSPRAVGNPAQPGVGLKHFLNKFFIVEEFFLFSLTSSIFQRRKILKKKSCLCAGSGARTAYLPIWKTYAMPQRYWDICVIRVTNVAIQPFAHDTTLSKMVPASSHTTHGCFFTELLSLTDWNPLLEGPSLRTPRQCVILALSAQFFL